MNVLSIKYTFPFLALSFAISTVYAQTTDTAWLNAVESRIYTTDKTGDIAGAIKVLTEALDTAYMRYGVESATTAIILERLGDSQRKVGDYKGVEKSISAQLDICRKLYGNRDKRVALALTRLGYARFKLGQSQTLEQLYTESRQILQDLGMQVSREMTQLNSNLAGFYQSKGLFVKAEQMHLEAIRIERALPDFNEINYAGLLNNTAVFYSISQRSNDAVAYYDQTMEILGKYVPENHPYFLSSLENKGRTLVDAGRYREAELTLKKALNLAKASLKPEDPQLAQLIRGVALLYTKTGQYEEAIRLVEESLVLLEKQSGNTSPEYITGLLNLATLHQKNEQLANADTLLHRIIQILEQNDHAQTTQYARALTQLGQIYQQTRQLGLARPLIEKGARIGTKVIGIDHPTYHELYGEALVQQNLLENHPDSALNILNTVHTPIITAYGKQHERFIKMEIQYGQAWRLKNDAVQSLQHFSAAFVALQDILAENFRFLSVNEREKFARTFEDYRAAFLAASRTFPAAANFQTFLYNLTLFQKELLASYDRQLLAGWQQNADSTYRRYVDVRQMIARQWTLPVEERLDLPELETERTVLEKALAENLNLSAEPDAFHLVQWQQVQQALQAGDAALEWLSLPATQEGRDAPCYAVLVLLPGNSAPELVLLPPTEQADALFASKGTRGLRYATRTYSTEALYEALWKPLENQIKGVKRIFYAPTGALHLLNFDAIPGPGGLLLSEKYQLVRVANTARLLDAGFGAGITKVGAALLAGGLNYEQAAEPSPADNPDNPASIGALWRGGGSTVREWTALPNTLSEVEHLANLLQQKNVKTALLTGTDGSEAAVKAYCTTGPGILHFATHGFFFEKNTEAPGSLGLLAAENPMFRSGLILAGANPAWRGDAPTPGTGTLDDGILTADEISLLPLRNTALVVLSACETGLGDVHDDEGVYGLQRAFRLAGAQNIIMSLWRVPDVQTREFMEKFYTTLLENGDMRKAFQSARQAMKKQYDNPFYWAGFVLLE